MKTHIFYLKSQKNPGLDQTERYRSIASLLRKHVFSDIDIEGEGIEIDKIYSEASEESKDIVDIETMHNRGKLYLKLLKASSIINVDVFSIVVWRDQKTAWGYIDRKKDANSDSYLEITQSNIASLFPAVAIMDRMVMLPEGIKTGLNKHPPEFLWGLKPLELGGVTLVDFGNEKLLKKAILQLEAQLKTEIEKLCIFHTSMHQTKRPDFGELSKLLKIDVKFFEPLENELLFMIAKLTSSIVYEESEPAVVGKSSRVALGIRNTSSNPINQVRVRVIAPPHTLDLPVSEILDLSAGGAASIPLQISPQATPYCPLEVIVDLSDNANEFNFPIPVILDVLPEDKNR